ncbi:MAG: hypothetical protein K2H09_08300 [Treponemataceae bacterium]|nr:hypothetical protein [Treponemataceae bacterium]
MKKLLAFAAGAALALGLAGCTGDLHDVEDPNKMEGSWFCYEVDTSKVTDDTINVIFNDGNGGNCQTVDIKGVQKTGSIHYLWAAATKSDAAVVSLREDNPDEGFGKDPGKLGVYVFTNSPVCYVYAWGDNTPNTDVAGGWPGKLMLKPGEEPPATAVATISVEATGVAAGTKYWFSGLSWDAGWPYGSWGGDPAFATDDDHAKYRATADGSGTAVWSGPFTMEVNKDDAKVIEFKFIDIVDANLASGRPTFNPDNIKAEIPAISSDTSFKLVITCKTDNDGMYVEGAKFEPAD